jgi:hypothetical protein
VNVIVTFFIALLSAIAGGASAIFVAEKATRWFHVSEREGGRGYAVMGFGLLGLVGGFAVGFGMSRLLGGGTMFFRECFGAIGATLGTVGLIWWYCWEVTDHAPRLDGARLWLEVEIRSSALETFTGIPEGKGSVRLTDRRFQIGEPVTFRTNNPRGKNGEWFVSTKIFIGTRRPKRILMITIGKLEENFMLPLPGKPRRADLEWTIWLPRARTDGKPAAHTLNYRYRVVPEKKK